MDKLTTLLNQSGINQEKLKAKVAEVKKDKRKLTKLAENHFQNHKEEILEGTKKRQLLLEDGKRRGLTEDQVLSSSGFIPSVYTPILNWLY